MTSGGASSREVERLVTEPMERLIAILDRGEQQLDARRAELAEVRYALFQLSAEGATQAQPRGGGAFEPLTADRAAPVLRYLLEQTTEISRVCTMSIEVGAGV